MIKLSIIMTVYNEHNTIEQLLKKVEQVRIKGIKKEIIIVESNSTDGSREIVKKYDKKKGIKTIYEDKPQGKGHAVKEGIKNSTGDIILIQDADLEYDVNDYKELLQPILKGKTQFVLGSRHLNIGSWKIRKFSKEPIKGFVVNICARGLDIIFNILNFVWLTDPQTMYKVFTRSSIKGIKFKANHFDWDWEIVTKLIKRGYKPIEIPVNYKSRSTAEGKKIKFIKDGFRNLWSIIRYRFSD